MSLLGQGEHVCIFCHELLNEKKYDIVVCPHCNKQTVVALGIEKGVRY